MISVKEAINKMLSNPISIEKKWIRIEKALGYYCASPIYSKLDIPQFNTSAVDGYAINTNVIRSNTPYTTTYELPAGKYQPIPDNIHIARIYTGAHIPNQFNSIVMQENVTLIGNSKIILKNDDIKPDKNIRYKGTTLPANTLLFEKGHRINPATIGVLASQGITKINVFKVPKITCIITGSELKHIDTPTLELGEIYETNSYTIHQTLKQEGIEEINIKTIGDDFNQINDSFINALNKSDIIIFSGGISVGKYDYIHKLLRQNNVKEIFYKIAQKPGKPLFFGKKDNTAIFALPGNPGAALNAMYLYVLPYIKAIRHAKNSMHPTMQVKLATDYRSKKGRTRFLKGITDFNKVTLLNRQSSDALWAFALANCLVEIPAEIDYIPQNNLVKIHLINQQ